jgi:choline dehydrogenase-like flavoprotein
MMTLLFAQQSRGTVKLASKDCLAKPVIDPRYLENSMDEKVLVEGCRFANSLVRESKAMEGKVVEGGFLDVLGGRYAGLWDGVEREGEGWKEYVREYTATAHHPSGTCRMGWMGGGSEAEVVKAREKGVVVDERLRVLGVKGLWVADCSIVPKLCGGHTQMVAYAIGEKAAEMLIEERKAQSTGTAA